MRTTLQPGRRGILRAAVLLPLAAPAIARAAAPVQLISHRYPALEFYAKQMAQAVPGVAVEARLMPFDKALELQRVMLSAHADGVDLLYTTDTTVLEFARNGWLRPLDDLWQRFKNEFALGDFADKVMQAFTVGGHIYVMPHNVTVMLMFLRKDLMDAAGLREPRTVAEYRDLAKALNTPRRAGTVSCLKPVDATLNEAHWYLNALGDGWFGPGWTPSFDSAKGIAAIDMLRQVTASAQPGFTAAGNDECTVALQQDLAAAGLQWSTRAKAMDDPAASKVVGKMTWIAPPQGGARFSTDGYAISAFSKQDPETLFRIIAHSASEASMHAAGALILPPRRRLQTDPDRAKISPSWPAAAEAMNTSALFPALPDFYTLGDGIARHIQAGVTGQAPIAAAMHEAATETAAWLKQHAER